MLPTLRATTAFRWRPTAIAAKKSDFVRVFDDDGVLLVVIANGYESGFSTCWPPASRWVLDQFAALWPKTRGAALHLRLADTFLITRQSFTAIAPQLLAPNADFPDDVPDATLIAVAIDGTAIDIAWVGGDRAIVARGDRLVAMTEPHTLRHEWRKLHPEMSLERLPNVTTQLFSGAVSPSHLHVDANPGDRVLVAGGAYFRHEEVESWIALPHAEAIADRGYDNEEAYAAVATLTI